MTAHARMRRLGKGLAAALLATATLLPALAAPVSAATRPRPHSAQSGGIPDFINGLSFADASHGWAVGFSYTSTSTGLVLATSDGGTTWTKQPVPADISGLIGVRFVSATRGFAVGESVAGSGVVIQTSNGGATWTAQSVSGSSVLAGVDFVTALSGWAVGAAVIDPQLPPSGVIYHTVDGGTTWTQQAAPSGTETLSSVSFSDALHGIAVGGGSAPVILVTANGGTTWTSAAAPSGVNNLTSVAFARGTGGAWAAGEGNTGGVVLMTTTSGASWTTQAIPADAADLHAIAMVDATHGWAVGQSTSFGALIIATTNGTSWADQSAPAGTGVLGAVAAVSTTTAWAAGDGSCGNVAILGTTNGGASWTEELPQTPYINDLQAVASPDATHVYVAGSDSCGAGVMLASSNGGVAWTRQTLPAGTGSLSGLSFVSASTGWASGISSTSTGGAILKTADGGVTWTAETVPTSAGDLPDITFVDASHGWAVGSGSSGPLVLATSNGGSTWTAQTMPAGLDLASSLSGVAFSGGSNGWAVGMTLTPNGTANLAIATTDGGTTWHQQTVPATVTSLEDVDFVSTLKGWAVGGTSTAAAIIGTSDGGTTWIAQPVPANTYGLGTVDGLDASTAWAMGTTSDANGSNGPLKTSDGGTTWSVQPISPNVFTLDGGSFLSTSSGWTAGVAGCPSTGGFVAVIYHTANGGTTWSQQYGSCGPTGNAPVVSGIQPNFGPEAGGTTVTVSGSGFTGATAVNFGAKPATSFHVVSDTSLTAVVPSGTGTVQLTVVTPGGTSSGSAGSQFTYLPASSVLPAMSNGAYGGYVTVAYLKNAGSSAAHAAIAYVDENGNPVGAGDSATIPVNGNATIRQDNAHGLPAGTAGSAIVYSDQPLAAFVNEFAPGSGTDATSYTAIRVPGGVGPTLYAPAIANGAYGGYTTGIGLLNLGGSPTDVTITYRDTTGSTVKTQSVTAVPSRAYRGLYSGDATLGLAAGFAGTATIQSTGSTPLAAVVNEIGPNNQFSSYDAVNSGATNLNAPVMLNGAYGGYYTGMAIQNTTGTAGTVTVAFYDGSGTHVTPDVTASIAANAYLPLYQGAAGQGPPAAATGYTGVVTSTVAVAAIVNEVAPPSAQPTQSTSYNTFAGGSPSLHLALVENAGSDGWTTGIGVMNTGSATTHVTVTYYDAATGAALTPTQQTDLAAHAFYGPYQGAPALLPPGQRATAVITTSAGGQVAVICNEQAANGFMSYDGQ